MRFGFAAPAVAGDPRMLRIRDDKPLHEADTLDTLRRLMSVS